MELILNSFGITVSNVPSQFEWSETGLEHAWNNLNRFRTGLEPVLNRFFVSFFKVAKL